jgi:cytoskeletal protein CcmA (bactofilin family)
MWNKREEFSARPATPVVSPPPVPAQAPPAPVSGERHEAAGIGPSIRIVGDVSGDEDLTILGKVEGKIALPKHSVTIGPGGRVKADIQAKYVSVAGEVHGNLVAGEQIVIRKTATMLGNLTAPRVGLEDGCRFRGSVEMENQGEKGRSPSAPTAAGTSAPVPSSALVASAPAKPEPPPRS